MLPNFARSRQGFSLIEVTLALGIGAFALLAIFGLLPVGLQSFRSAMDATAEAQIVQQIVGQAQLTSFGKLADIAPVAPAAPKEHYFDDEGQRSDYAGNPIVAGSAFHKYTAKVSMTQPTPIPAANSNAYVATLKIVIEDKANPGASTIRSAQLANLGI